MHEMCVHICVYIYMWLQVGEMHPDLSKAGGGGGGGGGMWAIRILVVDLYVWLHVWVYPCIRDCMRMIR